MRVSDSEVERFLIWARNYREIESYKVVAPSGRKWLITMPAGRTFTASDMEPGWIERSIVPGELVLTSREALVFGYGIAVAGGRMESRRAFAEREWGWGKPSEGDAATYNSPWTVSEIEQREGFGGIA